MHVFRMHLVFAFLASLYASPVAAYEEMEPLDELINNQHVEFHIAYARCSALYLTLATLSRGVREGQPDPTFLVLANGFTNLQVADHLQRHPGTDQARIKETLMAQNIALVGQYLPRFANVDFDNEQYFVNADSLVRRDGRVCAEMVKAARQTAEQNGQKGFFPRAE